MICIVEHANFRRTDKWKMNKDIKTLGLPHDIDVLSTRFTGMVFVPLSGTIRSASV